MAWTITFSLLASLVVALTVVPCAGSTVLKKQKDIKHPLFDKVLNGYEKLLRFHRESGSAVTMVCAEKHVTIPYGVVETGESGVITAMQEKPAFQFLTNTGLYLVEPEVLDDIGEDEVIGFPDIIERQRRRGRRVSAYTVGEEDWLDMGQLDELEKMRERLYGKP